MANGLLFCVILASALFYSKATLCSKIVKIESEEVKNYLANATFTAPVDFNGKWSLLLKTQSEFTFFGGWGIRIKTDSTNKLVKITSAESVDLFAGDEITFRFRLYWAENSVMPIVSSIVWEDHDICTKSGKGFLNLPPRFRSSVYKYRGVSSG